MRLINTAIFNRRTHHRFFRIRTIFQHINQRQSRLTLAQIVAHVFTQNRRIARVIQNIIGQLERRAQMTTISGTQRLLLGHTTAHHRGQLRRSLKQSRGFIMNHLHIARLGHVRIVHIEQLQNLAFGNHIGRVGQNLHHAHALHADHHLKRARIQKVTDQHAGRIAKHRVRRLPPTAQIRFIHHIIVQQRGRMDKLHHCRQRVCRMRARILQRAREQQMNRRTQTFAACRNQILRNLVHQRHFRVQGLANHFIELIHIGANRRQWVMFGLCAAWGAGLRR